MAKKFIQELKQEAIDQGVFGTAKLRKWMTDKVQSLVRKPISKRVLASEIRRGATKFQIPGKMYFFHYSPKLKDKLPYYDSFPLVIIIEMYGDGFLGLNLHYLPLKMRMNLLGRVRFVCLMKSSRTLLNIEVPSLVSNGTWVGTLTRKS